MSVRLDTFIRKILPAIARLNRAGGPVQPKDNSSGREDRWREFGFDGYSEERSGREIVIERCPLEHDSYRNWRGRKGGHCAAAEIIDAIRHVAGARGWGMVAPARRVGAQPDARMGRPARHR